MLYTNLFNNVKTFTIALALVVMTGCGGGRATTSTAESSGNLLGTAELSWLPPTTYTDKSTLTDLAGHNIYINDGSGFKKLTTINNPGVTAYMVENLSAGTYTFVITAFDVQGIESAFSNEANITI